MIARQLRAAGSALPDPLLVEAARAAIHAGDASSAGWHARAIERSLLIRVINATGVLLHTNLGRAPIARDDPALCQGYANLELDLASGNRGARVPGVTDLLRVLTGAEDTLVTNNGAAAVLLALAAGAAGTTVIVSRGQVVEIGGGFRIPEILALSGAHLVEVGTTNITRLADYQQARDAASPEAGAILVVHQSNFTQTGFVASVPVAELTTLGLPVVVDAGSGLLDANTPWLLGGPPRWLAGEPAVRQTLEQGAALVTFSGDKLLAGPQAGILAGDGELVARCRAHPLARALRPGRLVLSALQETLLAYLRRDVDALPLWRAATAPYEEVRHRAEAVAQSSSTRVVDCNSVVGGGAAPHAQIPSAGVAMAGDHKDALCALDPPVVARVVDGETVCDLRTVDPEDDATLGQSLVEALSA